MAPVLSDWINVCFYKCVCSKCLKIAKVIRTFDKGDTEQAFNYRLISILSQFDKIMEKLIYNRITSFITKITLSKSICI